jgi:hypothetical protein
MGKSFCKSKHNYLNFVAKVKETKMAKKKVFLGIPVMILKFGIVVFLSCGLTSCFSLLGGLFGGSSPTEPAPVPAPPPPEPKSREIVYKEVSFAELLDMDRNNNPSIGTRTGMAQSSADETRGFIVKAYLLSRGDDDFVLCDAPPVKYKLWGSWGWDVGSENKLYISASPLVSLNDSSTREATRKEVNARIDFSKPLTVYIAPETSSGSNRYYWYITKIDGLLSGEEAIANGKLQDELLNADDKYDAANFVLVPSDFKPSDYDKADLFDAVAAVGKFSMGDRRRFISDVVFVSQSGTTVLFKTADNAISQYMKIDARSGLTPGQKVRIYYRVTRDPLTEWQIIAIEKG